MVDIVKGSCLCEGIKFTVQGAPDAIFICYCSHCKKNAGAAGQISAKFKCEDVTVLDGTELMNTWILNDNLSGCEKHKKFCSRCGCTLWTIPMKHSGSHWIVRTALLEDGFERFPYRAEFFASRKVPLAAAEVKSFDTMPGAK
ncbi:Mss4-like protein [Triangularia verruculosa]|uniref:Mss4-like protein n=1 Tax=Triangularia verruculosa TaxID=2587418 RepID=A0AAN7AUE4_9PEZI|nr:Mss4-like protein [Triangularia verruculosa]